MTNLLKKLITVFNIKEDSQNSVTISVKTKIQKKIDTDSLTITPKAETGVIFATGNIEANSTTYNFLATEHRTRN